MPAKKHNWPEEIKPLLKKYKGTRHPLEYKNIYQLQDLRIGTADSKN